MRYGCGIMGPHTLGFDTAGAFGLGRGDVVAVVDGCQYQELRLSFHELLLCMKTPVYSMLNTLGFPSFAPLPTRQWTCRRLEKGRILPWSFPRASNEYGFRLKFLFQNAEMKSKANKLTSDPVSLERCVFN